VCLILIAAVTSVVVTAEKNMNKGIIDLRMNIISILKNIQDNCSKLLKKYPD